MRPWVLRPPVLPFLEISVFSGLAVVISAKSETVWNRRPGEVGLRFLIAISDSEEVDRIAFGERDQGALGVLATTPGPALSLHLAFAVHRVHPHHPDVEDRLDGGFDLPLDGAGVDHEDVGVVVLDEVVRLLRDHRGEDDVVWVFHQESPPSSLTKSLSLTS